MIQILEVHTFYRDGGDGSGTTYVHSSLEALKHAHFAADKWTSQEVQDRKFQETVDGDDTYENGEIGTETIEIEMDANGVVSLAKSFSIHWGQ